MPENKISLVTDAEGLDKAMLHFFNANAAKAEAELVKLNQETKTLAAKETYYEAQTQLAVEELRMYDDVEARQMRKQNIKLRARKENRELQRELSTQGRREPGATTEPRKTWREGTQPVRPAKGEKPAVQAKPSEKPLTHRMQIEPAPVVEQVQQEAAAN